MSTEKDYEGVGEGGKKFKMSIQFGKGKLIVGGRECDVGAEKDVTDRVSLKLGEYKECQQLTCEGGNDSKIEVKISDEPREEEEEGPGPGMINSGDVKPPEIFTVFDKYLPPFDKKFILNKWLRSPLETVAK